MWNKYFKIIEQMHKKKTKTFIVWIVDHHWFKLSFHNKYYYKFKSKENFKTENTHLKDVFHILLS
jgi:hypothetical protein